MLYDRPNPLLSIRIRYSSRIVHFSSIQILLLWFYYWQTYILLIVTSVLALALTLSMYFLLYYTICCLPDDERRKNALLVLVFLFLLLSAVRSLDRTSELTAQQKSRARGIVEYFPSKHAKAWAT